MKSSSLCNSAALISFGFVSPGDAFSSTPSTPQQRTFIEFTNPLARQTDRLPASLISNWPTWTLNLEESKWEKIPDSDGFVPPTSISELWQPQDLKPPQCQLAVGLHIRDGMIRHILPAVDLSLKAEDNNDEHRNRGLCSVPRAYEWMDFGAAMAGGLDGYSMMLQISSSDNNSDGDGEAEQQWETVAEMDSIEESITAAIQALADNPPDELGDGSTVVHVLCDPEDVVECPRPGSEMRVLLQEDGVTVGTLQVSVEKTAAGSESEFLPDAYKPLFEDMSLRRPAFIETKRRMELKEEQSSVED